MLLPSLNFRPCCSRSRRRGWQRRSHSAWQRHTRAFRRYTCILWLYEVWAHQVITGPIVRARRKIDMKPATDPHGDWKIAIREDRVIVGGLEDFMEVRHLVLTGTNEEIGRALATIAIERFGLAPEASTDRLRTRMQRRYIEMNYPILHDRMRGVAAAFGKHLDDDEWNFSSLPYLFGPPPGCSVVY